MSFACPVHVDFHVFSFLLMLFSCYFHVVCMSCSCRVHVFFISFVIFILLSCRLHVVLMSFSCLFISFDVIFVLLLCRAHVVFMSFSYLFMLFSCYFHVVCINKKIFENNIKRNEKT